jgi:hypothetical protein
MAVRTRATTGGLCAVLVACAPRPVAEPAPPEPRHEAALPAPAPAALPSPVQPEPPPSPVDEIAGLDPDAQWAWAVERMPALAEHVAIDRAELLAQLPEWFPEGRVFVRVGESAKCFPIEGAWTGDAFVGRARERVTTKGRTKERVWYTVEVSPSGIIETGPSGETSTKNAQGKWEVTGGFGTGCMDVLVQRSVSEITPDAVRFAAYDYTLTIECAGTSKTTDVCEGGGTRDCERCSSLWAQPHASGMGFGRGSIAMHATKSTPIDCSTPCPPDSLTPLLEPLNAIVKDRSFTGTTTMEGAVYKSRRACERDPRWTPAAAEIHATE